MSTFVDFHVLQSVPFANLNRDDLGSPKTVTYGGKDRTRVSSQSWKRVIRHDVEDRLDEQAKRTRLLPTKVIEELKERDWPADLAVFAAAQVALSATGKEGGLKLEDPGKTSVLLYLPESAVQQLADLCQEHRSALESAAVSDGKPAKGKGKAVGVLPTAAVADILKSRTATINLFGRMLAELPGGQVDGAVQ